MAGKRRTRGDWRGETRHQTVPRQAGGECKTRSTPYLVTTTGRVAHVEVAQRGHDLNDDAARVALGEHALLLEAAVEVGSATELQHRREGVEVDLEHVEEPHNARVLELLQQRNARQR
jgi:hypothetical protein